jgi:hypothetical protein
MRSVGAPDMLTQGLLRGSKTGNKLIQQRLEWVQISGFQTTVISPLVYRFSTIWSIVFHCR